jgi:hypothetical protein
VVHTALAAEISRSTAAAAELSATIEALERDAVVTEKVAPVEADRRIVSTLRTLRWQLYRRAVVLGAFKTPAFGVPKPMALPGDDESSDRACLFFCFLFLYLYRADCLC